MVLVVHEIFGVHEHIQDICRRLAKAGYLAVAPAFFAREGDVSRMSDIKEIMKVASKVPDSQVAADLDAAVAWAQAPARRTPRNSASWDFAGAAGRSGCTPRTTPTSRREWPGMDR